MRSAQKALEYNAQNLANVNTPAYRPQEPYFESAFSAMWDGGKADQQLPWGVQLQPGSISSEPGSMKPSNNPLAAALSDPNDYFVVDTAQGPRYTRNGDFHQDAQGNVVNAQGQALQGEFGPLRSAPGVKAQFNAAGQFQADGAQGLPVKVANLASSDLLRQGSQLFDVKPGAPVAEAKGHLVPQQLEGSGVDVFKGMADLVMLMRWAESAQKAARAADDAASALIQAAKL
jgi:flagellar basal body rod protein FlgG